MAKQGYEFDRNSFNFRQASVHVWQKVLGLLKFILVSFSLTAVFFLVLSLLIDTDVAKRLKKENNAYSLAYAEMLETEELLADAIASVQQRDDEIYNRIFHTASPALDPINSLDFLFGSDTIPDTKIVTYTKVKADNLLSRIDAVEANFAKIYEALGAENFVMPPMSLPLEGVTYSQVGASVGDKLSPFLKAYVPHSGIDFISAVEKSVYATEDGIVTDVVRSRRGHGNVIVISHEGGYETRYEHLSETGVKKGRSVSKGQKIGTVGISGNSFAPHLHYEILKDGVPVDPVDYLFGAVGPDDYANMLFMAVNTDQSMD